MVESVWGGAPAPTAAPSEAARGSEHLFTSRYQSSDLESEDWRILTLLFVSWPNQGCVALAETRHTSN